MEALARRETRLAAARVIRRVARGVLSSDAVPESEAVSANASSSLPSIPAPVRRAAARSGTWGECSGCLCRASGSCAGAFRCAPLPCRRREWQCCALGRAAGALGGRPMRFPLADSRGRATYALPGGVCGLCAGGSFRLRDALRASNSRLARRRDDCRLRPPLRPSVWLLASLLLTSSSASESSSSLVHCSSYRASKASSTQTPASHICRMRSPTASQRMAWHSH